MSSSDVLNLALSHACGDGDFEQTKALLASDTWSLSQRQMALVDAAFGGSADCVTALLAFEDINPNDPAGNDELTTPLVCAATESHPEAIAALLADPRTAPNARDKDGSTALMSAILFSQRTEADDGVVRQATVQTVRLLAPRTDLNAVDNDGDTALMIACLEGREPLVLELLRQGADPAFVNESGVSAILRACENEAWDAADLLAPVSPPALTAAVFAQAGAENMPRWAAHLETQELLASVKSATSQNNSDGNDPTIAKAKPARRF